MVVFDSLRLHPPGKIYPHVIVRISFSQTHTAGLEAAHHAQLICFSHPARIHETCRATCACLGLVEAEHASISSSSPETAPSPAIPSLAPPAHTTRMAKSTSTVDDTAAQGAGILISAKGGTTKKPRKLKERPSAQTNAANPAATEARKSKRNEKREKSVAAY